MRRFLAVLFLCLLIPTHVVAKPSRLAVDAFRGDRWERVAQAGTTAADVNHIMRCPPPHCARRSTKAKWKKRHKPVHWTQHVVRRVPVPVARPVRDEEQEAAYRVIAALLAGGKVYVKPPEPAKQRLNILQGFAREIVRAAKGVSLAGVVAPLAAKAIELSAQCGSRVISARRNTYVAGTRRISLHASGRAVDMAGNPSCMYALLRRWPGGVSVDYARVKHIHISYAPPSRGHRGREWGVRFAHRGGVKRTRYARHHRHHLRPHYARAF